MQLDRPTIARGLERARRRNGPRFTTTARGTPRMIEHRRRETYKALLRETPQHDADLVVERDDDGDWTIQGKLPEPLAEGHREFASNHLARGACWDREEEAQEYLDEHEDELRDELVDNLFTMGLCTTCDQVVPVFGDYVPFAPAGMLVCGDCMAGDGDDPAAPAIIHP